MESAIISPWSDNDVLWNFDGLTFAQVASNVVVAVCYIKCWGWGVLTKEAVKGGRGICLADEFKFCLLVCGVSSCLSELPPPQRF